jgi:hypothetical protein
VFLYLYRFTWLLLGCCCSTDHNWTLRQNWCERRGGEGNSNDSLVHLLLFVIFVSLLFRIGTKAKTTTCLHLSRPGFIIIEHKTWFVFFGSARRVQRREKVADPMSLIWITIIRRVARCTTLFHIFPYYYKKWNISVCAYTRQWDDASTQTQTKLVFVVVRETDSGRGKKRRIMSIQNG